MESTIPIQECITMLDVALIVGGPSLHSLIHSVIEDLETNLKSGNNNLNIDGILSNNIKHPQIGQIEVIDEFIPMSQFKEMYINKGIPVIVKNSISHWRAFQDHDWNCVEYWMNNFGHRTVPVEIGNDYRKEAWNTKLMTINDFISKYILNPNGEQAYLAQSRIFEWIPSLRKDIAVPDYVDEYSEEIINIWFVSKK